MWLEWNGWVDMVRKSKGVESMDECAMGLSGLVE